MSNRIDPMNQGLLGKIGQKVSNTAGTTKVNVGSTAADKKSADKPASGDTVELTHSAKLLERLEKTLGGLPEIERARVEAVKTAIANGDYEIDAEKIAEAILRSEQELGF